jgi:hypothetical protein
MLTASQCRTVGLFINGEPTCIKCSHEYMEKSGVPYDWNRTDNDIYAFAQLAGNREDIGDIQDLIEYNLDEMVSAYNEHVFCSNCGEQMDDYELDEEEDEPEQDEPECPDFGCNNCDGTEQCEPKEEDI